MSSCTLTPESGDPGASVCGRAKLHSGRRERIERLRETRRKRRRIRPAIREINPESQILGWRQRDLAAFGVFGKVGTLWLTRAVAEVQPKYKPEVLDNRGAGAGVVTRSRMRTFGVGQGQGLNAWVVPNGTEQTGGASTNFKTVQGGVSRETRTGARGLA